MNTNTKSKTENSTKKNSSAAGRIDLPGIVRRVRRIADMSQRDLAAATGLGTGTIARAELGESPLSLSALLRILDVAGLRLGVLDDAGDEVEPMRPDPIRDNAGRRYPAHLDARLPHWPRGFGAGLPHARPVPKLYCEQRRRRDLERARSGAVPGDHPGEDDQRRLHAEQLSKQQANRARIMANEPVQPPLVACFCGPECETYCVDRCGCQCEPRPGRPANLIRRWPRSRPDE